MKRSRTFTARDDLAAPPVVIINESMAKRFWKDGSDPMNERVVIGKGVMHAFDTEPARQIVGIVADSRDNALNRVPGPMMFIPQAQEADAVNALSVRIAPTAWVVRTRGEPHGSSAAIQADPYTIPIDALPSPPTGGRILWMPDALQGRARAARRRTFVQLFEKEDSMSLSRRHFFRNLGLGSAGLLSTSFIIGRGREAMAFEAGAMQVPDDGGFIRISSNENARGPGPKTIEALRNTISPRVGRGYPPDNTVDLVATIAGLYGVGRDHVIVGTGSGAILEAGTRAFCSAEKPLVTAAPTYGTPDQAAHRIGAPVKMIRVDRSLGLDIDAMAEAAKGAGMIFFCNPNNPTGTVHNAATVERFVRRIKQSSPETRILIDEAYLDYAHDDAVKTAAPLARELPGVFVTRSFSKAHGMAGLRLGYAIGQPETVQAISRAWSLGSINTLSAAAGIASLRDPKHIEEERAENARVRDFTLQAFKNLGFEAPDSHTNCIFVDLKRPASQFREACAALKVSVGRDFPPFEKTHSRITLGTMDEMKQAMQVFRRVLTMSSTGAGAR